jgi:hypothetical protein
VTTWILIIVLLIGEDVIVMESPTRYQSKEECLDYGSKGIYQDLPDLLELRMSNLARVYCSPVEEISA